MPSYLQKFMGPGSFEPIPDVATPGPAQPEMETQPAPAPIAMTPETPGPMPPQKSPIDQILQDQDFMGLPPEEKAKVLMAVDPDFASLPQEEQLRAVQMMAGQPNQETPRQSGPGDFAGMLMEENQDAAIMDPQTRSNIYRPILEAGGTTAGSIIGAGAGAPTGPGAVVTGAVGAAAGYTAGKQMADYLDILSGIKERPTMKETAIETAKDIGTGAAMEIGGQLFSAALVPTARGAKYVFKKAAQGAKGLFSKKAMEEAAGKVLMAHTSEGTIYAKNMKQAAEIEKEIPGLKFTLGQRSNDPNLIKLERSQMRKPGSMADVNAEQIAANNEALRAYYQKNFKGKEGIDDLIDALQGQRESLQEGAEAAAGTVRAKASELSATPPGETGAGIVSEIESAKAPIKSAMSELEEAVPDYPMDFKNTFGNIQQVLDSKKLSISQRKAVEKALGNVQKLLEQGKSTHTAFAVRRTLNDQISTAFKNQQDSIGAVLMKVKSGIDSDLADVAAMARSGKIAEYKGSIVKPDELAATLEKNAQEIAATKGLTQPDVGSMTKELNARGVPTMRQLRESDEAYIERISADYKRIMKKEIPTVENTTETARVARLAGRNEEIKKILSEVSPGQDVASSMKAFNDFASTQYFGRFDKGAVKTVMQKGAQASGKKMPADTVAKYFTTDTGANDLIRAVGREKAAGLMKGHYAYDMMQNATDATGTIETRRLMSWLKKNNRVLSKYRIESDFNNLLKAQKTADQAAKAAADFEKSAAARILSADPEKAIANAIKGNNSGKVAEQLMQQVKSSPAAVAGLKKSFADHIMSQIQTTAKDIAGNPVISNAAFQRNLAKYEPAMKVIYANDPGKMSALQTMRKAYEIAVRNTRSPIGGGADTAENVFTALGSTVHISRTASVVRAVIKSFGKHSQAQVDEMVTRAFFDPEYAETLIGAVKGDIPTKDLSKVINGKIIQLDEYRKRRLAAVAAGASAAIGGQ